jgi:hypothetical protein
VATKRAITPELEELDQFYRQGGLLHLASATGHYHDAACPHAGCDQKMEWIDFQLEIFGEPETIYKPLVRSWWEGTGFAGRCPACGGWIRFTTLRVEPLTDTQIDRYPKLPDNWHAVAQFA